MERDRDSFNTQETMALYGMGPCPFQQSNFRFSTFYGFSMLHINHQAKKGIDKNKKSVA